MSEYDDDDVRRSEQIGAGRSADFTAALRRGIAHLRQSPPAPRMTGAEFLARHPAKPTPNA